MKTPKKIAAKQADRIKKLKNQGKYIPYIIEMYSVNFLIPKKRGEGWLKYPVYHHVDTLSSLIKHELGYDICGLDGYINVDTGWTMDKDFSKLIRAISEFYGLECKLVNREWWYDQLIIKTS